MTAKRIVGGTLAGLAASSAIAYVMFGLLFSSFYSSYMNGGSAIGVERQPMLLWPVALAMLSCNLLLTLAIASRHEPATVARGVAIGAVVTFLLWATADLMLYGITNVGTPAGTLIAPFLELVPGAVAGGAAAATLSRMTPRSRALAPDAKPGKAA